MKHILSIQDQQSLASQLLKTDVKIIEKVSFILPDTNILLVMLTEDCKEIPVGYKGGIRLLVDNTGEVLFCSSSAISNVKLLEEFRRGIRTPIDSFKK